MKRPNRKLWGLLALLLAGLIPATNGGSVAAFPRRLLQVPETVWQAVESAFHGDQKSVKLDVLLETPQELAELKRLLREMGGQVTDANGTYIQVELPPTKVAEAVQKIPAAGIGVDQSYQVPPTVSADQTQPPVESDRIGESLRPSLDAMGVLTFAEQQGVTGKGIKIAVIDTGIDPGHIALKAGPDGTRKVMDFQDFTTEGKVFPSRIIERKSTYQAPEGRTFSLSSLPEGSHPRFGLWSEWGLSGKINMDLDQNGSQLDKFGVLVVDSHGDGHYDQVWVDGNNNADFRDDTGPLAIFRESGQVGQLGQYPRRTNYVVADVDPAGAMVSFAFDANGHGTAVSGVLAGWTADGYQGVAPGAQLLVLKAARSDGTAAWTDIRQAVQYAADQGAQIINISIAGLATGTQEDAVQGLWLRQISRQYKTLIVLAAGNGGPGLSSGATIGSPSELLAVGAYSSPAMWKRDHGWVVPTEGLYWQSAAGPRQDGGFVPNLVAPGGAPAPAPLWLQTNPYATASGTSIAAPHVSGAAALLLEAGRRNGLASTPDQLIRAMEGSARRLAGYDTFEQGFGLLQLEGAFKALAFAPAHPTVSVQSTTGGEGIFSRGTEQARAQLTLKNQGSAMERWTVNPQADWVQPELSTVTLPSGVGRRLDLRLAPPVTPGIYSSFLQFQRPGESMPTLVVPVTYVRPFQFPAAGRLQWSGALPVARSARQFVSVEPGQASLQLQARLGSEGAVQVRLYRPDARLAYDSGVLGGPEGVGLVGQFQTEHPIPGVWEMVVTAIPDALGAYQQVSWSAEARVEAGPIPQAQTRWVLPAGQRMEAEVSVTNTYLPATVRLEGVGLSRENLDKPWRTETKPNEIDTFDLPPSTGALRIEIANAFPASTDLDLTIYRDGTNGPVARSAKQGTSNEVLELRNPPPGRYHVHVGTNGEYPTNLFYQYRRLVAVEDYQLEVVDSAQLRVTGEKWTVPVTFYAAPTPGRYFGHLMVRDTDVNKGQSLNWTTIEVSVGQPALQIQPLFVPLVLGQWSQVVLELRDPKGALVNGMIKVNGRSYESREGQVIVPVYPAQSSVSLMVEADLKEYQYFRQELRLPVGGGVKNWSIGDAPNQENNAWWRKYQSELP